MPIFNACHFYIHRQPTLMYPTNRMPYITKFLLTHVNISATKMSIVRLLFLFFFELLHTYTVNILSFEWINFKKQKIVEFNAKKEEERKKFIRIVELERTSNTITRAVRIRWLFTKNLLIHIKHSYTKKNTLANNSIKQFTKGSFHFSFALI